MIDYPINFNLSADVFVEIKKITTNPLALKYQTTITYSDGSLESYESSEEPNLKTEGFIPGFNDDRNSAQKIWAEKLKSLL